MIKIYFIENCCTKCNMAKSMAEYLKSKGHNVEIFMKDGESNIHYPIMLQGGAEYEGDATIDKLARLGGDEI